jgi:hypothetical protein
LSLALIKTNEINFVNKDGDKGRRKDTDITHNLITVARLERIITKAQAQQHTTSNHLQQQQLQQTTSPLHYNVCLEKPTTAPLPSP